MTPETCTVNIACETLQTMCGSLRVHIYNAHAQWHSHHLSRLNLDDKTFMCVEDYQMKMELVYRENPTTVTYSSNKVSVRIYPICIEYKSPDGKICKGAVTFLSEYKEHSHQQVQQFEKRMF